MEPAMLPIPSLSAADIAEFKSSGFLIKRGVLSATLLAAARDRLWEANTSATLRRDDPDTWWGFEEGDCVVDCSGLNDRTAKHAWRCRELSGDETMIDLLPRRVMPWLEQLVGKGAVVQPRPTSTFNDPDPRGTRLRGWNAYAGLELRGVYCVLPEKRTAQSVSMEDAAKAGAHLDAPPKHLVVCGLLDDVPSGGGALALFPGSHTLLYEHNPSTLDMQASVDLHHPHPESGHGGSTLRKEYGLDVAACKQHLEKHGRPEEFCGSAGDVVLWHGRMFHSPTPNYSSNPPTIRQMALYDVVKVSTFDAFYAGYERGPCPSPPPNQLIAKQHPGALEKGPLAPRSYSFARLPESERASPGFWWDWSSEVRSVHGSIAAAL